MNDEQFSLFIDEVKNTFDMSLNTSQIQLWYKAFRGTDYDVAKKMIELFYNTNQKVRRPRPADLFAVKSWAQKVVHSDQVDDSDQVISCPYCKDTGIVIVARTYEEFPYPCDMANRCFCAAGNSQDDSMRQIRPGDIDRYRIANESPLYLIDTQVSVYGNEKRVVKHKLPSDFDKLVASVTNTKGS